MNALELTGVTKTFRSGSTVVTAVDGLDLTVRPGEVVAFLGPNGAGKTTTIDMILGLAHPTSGTVRVFGGSPRDAVARGLVSAVMQTGGLLPDISVRESVELTASLFGRGGAQEALVRAGIDDIADRRVKKCSGGQQQRLRFAMALVSDPALIILDEPTTGMDVEVRRHFWQAIHADAERGRTVLFATHYLEEADAYADRIVLVRRGRVVADGTAAQIRAMVSGRTLEATATAPDLAAVRAIPGVRSAELLGERLTVVADDTDAVARHLLSTGTGRDLEITSRGLEDAFRALTSDDAEPSAAEPNDVQPADAQPIQHEGALA